MFIELSLSDRLKERANALPRLRQITLAARGAFAEMLFDCFFHDVSVGFGVYIDFALCAINKLHVPHGLGRMFVLV